MLAFLKKKTKSFGRHKDKQRGKSRNMCGNKGIPEVALNSGHSIPVIGFGTFAYPISGPEVVKAVLEAIKVGYRHFDTASLYGTEAPLGEAIAEALSLGLIKSRDELFITSKIWCNDAHHDLVIPALKKTLQNLNLDYLDLYLIHFPISARPDGQVYPVAKEDIMVMDFKGVWAAMEKAQKLGLAKSIGVSNFSSKKLQELLATAKITPAINQVEVNPVWQQKKLIEFCKAKGIQVAAFSPLGSGTNRVIDNEVIVEIAKAKGKTVAQVCLRWAYEQGVAIVSKSFNEKRMKENLEIFDWELSKEDNEKISKSIPQSKGHTAADFVSETGPFKSVEDIWDDVV